MKKTIVTALLLLAGTTCAVAQAYPSQKSQSSSSAQERVRGCLGRTDGGFTLTDKAGTRYEVTGDTATLNKHVGHEVQLKGTKAEPSTPTGTPEATTNRIEARIDVSSVKHISETCSEKSKSGTEKPMSEQPPTTPR